MYQPTPVFQMICTLAQNARPGAIVIAEHAVDQHLALFASSDDRLTALDALARDLIRLGRDHAELQPFLRQVDDYIELVQGWPHHA